MAGCQCISEIGYKLVTANREKRTAMKPYLFLVYAGVILSLQGIEPILYYDFSDPGIRKGGKFRAPEFVGNVEIDSEQECIQLQPENYLAIPESASLSLLDGGTLYAVVYFDENGRKNGADDAHDMLFFKNKSFLTGRHGGKIYCNLSNGEKWQNGIFCNVPVNQWIALTMTAAREISKGKTYYTVTVYINGEQRKRVTWQFEGKGNRNPVTFGRGWGGPWFMKGKIAEIRIYPAPIGPAECKKISEASLRKLKTK